MSRFSLAVRLPMVGVMVTPTAPSSARSGIAAVARRYDAAVANNATPVAVTGVANDRADGAALVPAAYGADAAVSRTADEARGALVDLLA